MEVILGTFTPLAVGKLYKGISDRHGNFHKDQPFVVLREATKAEWIAFAEQEGHPLNAAERSGAQDPKAKFYGISTD